MSVETEETTETQGSGEKSEDFKKLEADIMSGVDEYVKSTVKSEKNSAEDEDESVEDEEPESEEPEDEVSEDEDEEDDGGSGKDEKDGDNDPEPETLSDEVLTRAVKAGLSISDARKFSSEETLSMVCDKLEAASKSSDEDDKDENVSTENVSADDLLSEIEDLDPEEYDEKIVNMFKAFKGIIRKQNETINGLKTVLNTDTSWFDSKMSSLDPALQKELEKHPEKRDAVREHYDILMDGYRAQKKTPDKDRAFDAAVKSELNDVQVKIEKEKKVAKLKEREGRMLNRPSGQNAKPKGDPFEDTASLLNEKFRL